MHSETAVRTIKVTLTVVFFAVIWEVDGAFFDVTIYLLPAPSEMLKSLLFGRVDLVTHYYVTLYGTLLGFAAAMKLLPKIPVSGK